MSDPYDYAALSLPSATRDAIGAFWAEFAAQEAGLDALFTTGSRETDPVAVMAALHDVSPELMWEFGKAETGHKVVITAEWNDDNRALARAVVQSAPQLRYFTPEDVRTPNPPEAIAELFAARTRAALDITTVTPSVSATGRMDIHFTGAASDQVLFEQGLTFASLALGETAERDWLGQVTTEKVKADGFFRRAKLPPLDIAAAVEACHAAIEAAKANRPGRPYGNEPPEARQQLLFNIGGQSGESHPRADLITYVASNEAFAQNLLQAERFSSVCHSAHGEWFVGLRIPNEADGPMDVSLRSTLEDRLHDALSQAGLGGFAAAGSGAEFTYIDLALTDVTRGLACAADALRGADGAEDAIVQFLDPGLATQDMPLSKAAVTLH
ncbi:hypothetical protein [Jannaschia pohangensis]|uniref:Uncharacterized protein n=1 Tax=Jannaschia pohangensis TaxID=390807 RepID=A0A1I3MUS3_9RHOB|nr:hypothetical protein [Jannaschia pohangensis]SFJ00763.1 hypothetical protein SAMN04488095_1964 [Jannaschia pohangensis]